VPPAASLVCLLEIPKVLFEPHHQVFGSLPSASFIEGFGLRLDNALLHGLVLPTNMINLLLEVASIDNSMLQRDLDSGGFAPHFRGLGLGGS
jgi:hypothetical protein